jgi:hypothetical protein
MTRRGSWYESSVPRVEGNIEKGGRFADTPQQLAAFPKDIETRYPELEHVSLSTPVGTLEAIMLEQYRCVAAEVMPHVRR